MKYQESIITKLTLANAAQLVSNVCSEVLNTTDSVDNTVGELPLNEEMLCQLAQSSFQGKIQNLIKGDSNAQ